MNKEKKKDNKKLYKFRHKFLYMLLHPIYAIYLRFKMNFKFKHIDLPKAPCLIMCNHVTTYDPMYVPLALPKPIYIVTMDDLTSRKHYGKFIRNCLGVIPKSKGISDFQCVRSMMKHKNEGLNIALFPEANRCFDGNTCHIDPATIKLMKTFKVPTVFLNIIGGYGADPRWGNTFRKGYHTIKHRYTMSVDEINNLSFDELYSKVVEYLTVDNYDKNYTYKGKNKAEYLERFLFKCPDCGSISHLHTKGDDIYCDKCGYRESYQEDLTFKLINGKKHVLRVDDWAKIDKEFITSMNPLENTDELIFTDEHIDIYQVFKITPRELKVKDVTIYGYKNRIEFKGENYELVVPFDEVLAACPVGKARSTFYFKENAYQIVGSSRLNANKYVQLYYHYQNYKKGDFGMGEFLGI